LQIIMRKETHHNERKRGIVRLRHKVEVFWVKSSSCKLIMVLIFAPRIVHASTMAKGRIVK